MTAASGERYVLAPGVTFVPVADFPAAERDSLACEPGDVIVDRARNRGTSKLLSARTALLLEQFRAPQTVADAIVRFGRSAGEDPRALLEAAFEPIRALVAGEILVPAGQAEASAAWSALGRRGAIGPYAILRIVRRLGETAVFLARDRGGVCVAVKAAGPGATEADRAALDHEAACLGRIADLPGPRVLERAGSGECEYLALSWIDGLPVGARAEEIRTAAGGDRRAMLGLCRGIADLYAGLHAAGVLHGDVRASNLIADGGDRVSAIDFALARTAATGPALRSWDFGSLEPEAAERQIAGGLAPMTADAEQFAVGVLLYRLASGRPFRLPPPRQSDALAAIAAERAMPPFALRGAPAWPELEAALRPALAHDPADRYPSLVAFAEALREVRCDPPRRRSAEPLLPRALDLLRSARPDAGNARGRFGLAPFTAVHGGAAGLAWALYRAAGIAGDGELLALADCWARLASDAAGRGDGFEARHFGIGPERAARSSPLHDPAGPAAVRCLLATAYGRRHEAVGALAQVLEVAARPCATEEIFLGNAGHLATLATLRDALRGQEIAPTNTIDAAMHRLLDGLGSWAGATPALAHLGAAHGWAGILHAALIAAAELRIPSPAWIRPGLNRLAAAAEPVGRGLAWKGSVGGDGHANPAYAPGWCSGSAGYIPLWLAAFHATADERFRDLAVGAGWHAWDHPDASPGICCGIAGRVLALLRLHRAVGDDAWLDRADALLARGFGGPTEPASAWSLFRGRLGLALAAVERARPSESVMPLIEPEGWSAPPGT